MHMIFVGASLWWQAPALFLNESRASCDNCTFTSNKAKVRPPLPSSGTQSPKRLE